MNLCFTISTSLSNCLVSVPIVHVGEQRRRMNLDANGRIAELKSSATRVIVDPPFLSEDCQTKGMFPLISRRDV